MNRKQLRAKYLTREVKEEIRKEKRAELRALYIKKTGWVQSNEKCIAKENARALRNS